MMHIHLRLKALHDARSRAHAGQAPGWLSFSQPSIFNGLSAILWLALALMGRR